MLIKVKAETFRLAETFTISRGSRDAAEVLTVTVSDGVVTGRGECVPYARYGETLASVMDEIRALPETITRPALQETLPAGAARNAVDCAMWDLEAKQAGKRVWDIVGVPAPAALTTAFTLSLDTPENMAEPAAPATRPSSASEDQTRRRRSTWPGSKPCAAGAPEYCRSSLTRTRAGRPTSTPTSRRIMVRLGVQAGRATSCPSGARRHAGRDRAPPAGLRRRKLPRPGKSLPGLARQV